MVKQIIVACLIISTVYAENNDTKNIYEKACVSCHKELPMSLQRMFMRYLLVYGGEKNMKAGLRHYLKYPIKDISVMSKLFIDGYGIKKKTTLTNAQLDEAIDIYWEKFKVFDRLK